MKQLYQTPALVDYGPITDCTFVDPHRPRRHNEFEDECASGPPVVTT
jgi:hypothetical protein